jgi:hypothetical protein
MKTLKTTSIFTMLACMMLFTACAPQADANLAPTPDIIGTTAAQLAEVMLTQTAGAVTPTPFPPTETSTPQATETPTLEPAPVETAMPVITGNTACYAGPGSQYGLVSNLTDTEEVEIAGVSNTAGWYVIYNPIYGSLCWVSAEFLSWGSDFDPSTLPTMYP